MMTPELVQQYTSLGDELRFYADQRFKIAGAFLIANGFMASATLDHRSVALAVVGVVLAYLFLSWEKKTTLWWGSLIESLKSIEEAERSSGTGPVLVRAYLKYPELRKSRLYVKPSRAASGIYLLFLIAWLLFGISSWPCLW